MTFLFKYPTRARPDWFRETLAAYYSQLSGKHRYRFVVTMDEDDETMNNAVIRNWLNAQENLSYDYGDHHSKVEAINDGVPADDWDIIVLVSDDMVPVVAGFDDVIAADMQRHLPALDGCLKYADGFRPATDPLMTWTVMGRGFYQWYGNLYHPAYKGTWCDNELTEVALARGKLVICESQLVRHDWRKNGNRDENYLRDDRFYEQDRRTYELRKRFGFRVKQKEAL
jgi:hypothetical protein